MSTKEQLKDFLLTRFRWLDKKKYPDTRLNFKNNIITYGNNPELNTNPIPKIIWTFWSNKSKSALVDICISNLRLFNPGFDIRVVDETNLSDYLPNFDQSWFQHPSLQIQNVADLIRLELLLHHGGIWVDASVLTDKGLEDFIPTDHNQHDFVGFFDKLSENRTYPVLVETWFMSAPKNSRFIKAWHEELSKCYASSDPINYYKQRSDYALLIQHFENIQDYAIIYIAEQVTMLERSNEFTVFLYASEHGPAFVNHFGGWHGPAIARFLTVQPFKDINLPIVKIMGSGRKAIDEKIKSKTYKADSYLGRFIKKSATKN